MLRWFCMLLTALFLMGSIYGCSEEPVSKPVSKKPKVATKAPVKKAPSKSVESKKQEVKEKKFLYQSEGRRDPFVPLSSIKKPIGVSTGAPITPLERFELTQFRVLGVIVGKGDPKAMVKAPDGKSYILSIGTKIGKNSGVIIDINSQVLLVEEKYFDFSGNVRTNIQEIKVPRR